MAVSVETQTTGPSRGVGRLGRLLRDLIFRTREEQLVPRGFVQIPLAVGQRVDLGTVMRSQGRIGLAGVRTIVVNVELNPIRYCDADAAAPGYGELYAAGNAFVRTFRFPGSASFAAESGAAQVNVSMYAEALD